MVRKRAWRKQVNWWAAVLLSPILLRALIPVGFMPMVGSDFHVQLVVCEGDGPLTTSEVAPTSMPMGMPMDMSMPMDGADVSAASHGHTGHEDRGTCPYGSAPALGALPTLAIATNFLNQQGSAPLLATAQVAYVEVSPRAQSSRGPPV